MLTGLSQGLLICTALSRWFLLTQGIAEYQKIAEDYGRYSMNAENVKNLTIQVIAVMDSLRYSVKAKVHCY